MSKNPNLSPTKRATIVEMQNQKIKFKDISSNNSARWTVVQRKRGIKFFQKERDFIADMDKLFNIFC